MRHRRLRLLLCAVALLAPTPAIGEDLLDEVRREIDEDDPSRPCDDDDGWTLSFAEDDGELTFQELITRPIAFAVAAPWWLPHQALEDQWSIWPEFPAAPYLDGNPGFLIIDAPAAGPTRAWSARATALYGTDFGDLSWAGTRVVVDSASRFGIDTSWNQWIEQRPGGDDSLATGDANLVVRFAQSEQLQFHSGIGVNWLADHGRGDAGFNFTYGLDWFPQRPWVISASLDAGTLGGARLFHGQLGFGAVWEQIELFTGYDATRIGDATLDGLIAGIRVWF